METPIKLEAKVSEKGVEKLIDAALDTFSPVTETFGLLGDVVRLARSEVATAITRRAKLIADENGLTLTAPPLKFLVPFYEKSSIENEGDTTLMEMWARLLVSSGSNYDARQLRFCSLLAELSPTQAKILNGIATNYGGTIGEEDPDQLFYDMVEARLTRMLSSISLNDSDAIFDIITREVCRPGTSVVIISVITENGELWADWNNDNVYTDSLSVDFEILRSIGIIDRIATDFLDLKHAEVTVTLYHMTEMGYAFWQACRTAGPMPDKL